MSFDTRVSRALASSVDLGFPDVSSTTCNPSSSAACILSLRCSRPISSGLLVSASPCLTVVHNCTSLSPCYPYHQKHATSTTCTMAAHLACRREGTITIHLASSHHRHRHCISLVVSLVSSRRTSVFSFRCRIGRNYSPSYRLLASLHLRLAIVVAVHFLSLSTYYTCIYS